LARKIDAEWEALTPKKYSLNATAGTPKEQDPKTLAALNKLIKAAAPMVKGGTHAVLGEGPPGSNIAFVGEQPGDQEDLAGRPFVGPAGKLLDRAMKEAGIDRRYSYITNAVKHFKFEPRGKRRIHSKPTAGEVKHYRWWLEKELDFVKPRVVVALGTTAALALAGKPLTIGKNRGPRFLNGRQCFITIHPASLLRMANDDRAQAWREFVADMKRIRKLADGESATRVRYSLCSSTRIR